MALNIEAFSETLRQLGPNRFCRFVERALDVERADQAACPAVNKTVYESPEEYGVIVFRYVVPRITWGQTEEVSQFLMVHHVPSLIADLNYGEVYARDWEHAERQGTAQAILRRCSGLHERNSLYYITNKDLGLTHATNVEQMGSVMPIGVACIDPLSIARSRDTYEELDSLLMGTLRQPGLLALEISESGQVVRPFVSCDVVAGIGKSDSFVLNVDSTPLVAPRLESVQGLQDVITLGSRERDIESFLKSHTDILLNQDYVSLRTQITLAPGTDRPDFFLERRDGFWDVLELKRPIDERLPPDPSDFAEALGASLKRAIGQCQKYLIRLESAAVRRKLWENHGIRLERPTVTLLIGREQYPQWHTDFLRTSFESRIVVRSFEEVLSDSKQRAAVLLSEMRQLSVLNRH